MQPAAIQREFQIAGRQRLFGGFPVFGFPKASIPELNRAAPILAFGDRALEIAVIERVVFNLDRQSFIVRV